MKKLSFDNQTLRSFAFTVAGGLAVISALLLLKQKNPLPLLLTAMILIDVGMVFPGSLKPAYFLWMKLAFLLGWVNTRILLAAIYYLIFTPTALLIRLLGKDLLERKIDKSAPTYWREAEKKEFNQAGYERQF